MPISTKALRVLKELQVLDQQRVWPESNIQRPRIAIEIL